MCQRQLERSFDTACSLPFDKLRTALGMRPATMPHACVAALI